MFLDHVGTTLHGISQQNQNENATVLKKRIKITQLKIYFLIDISLIRKTLVSVTLIGFWVEV